MSVSELRAGISCTKRLILIQMRLSCSAISGVDLMKTIDNPNLHEYWNKKRRMKRRFFI